MNAVGVEGEHAADAVGVTAALVVIDAEDLYGVGAAVEDDGARARGTLEVAESVQSAVDGDGTFVHDDTVFVDATVGK